MGKRRRRRRKKPGRSSSRACDEPQDFRFLYPLDIPIKRKIEIIATKIYGADGVIYEPKAEEGIKIYRSGLG